MLKYRKILLYTITFVFFIALFEGVKPHPTNASVSKTVLIYQKEITKNMDWENPKWVTYPNSAYGTYPSTYSYDSGGYTGTLKASRIKLTPKEKIYHKDPVYRTDYQAFTKTTSKTYETNSSTNVPGTYNINENGYTGNISRTGLTWNANWIRNRTKPLTQYWTDSSYREFVNEAPEPGSYSGTYYDSPSGQNVSYSLPKSGGLYSIASKNGWVRYRAPGRAAYYDKYENYYLGFMSSNSSTYYAGNFSAPKPGEAPDRYYGIPRSYIAAGDWRLVNYGWDEANAVNADWWAGQGYASKLVYSSGSYWWKSESGRLNKYRKGVWIDYDLYVPLKQYRQAYSGTFNLPDYIDNYKANATYKGTLSKQVLDHYDEYYTSSKWGVEVEYSGTIYSTNLAAKSIAITDLSNNPVTYLVRGKQYKATMVISNNGDLNVGAYKAGFYEEGTRITQLDVPSQNKGTDKTLTYNFTAATSGVRTFMVKADDTNVLDETNETDNTKSVDKTVNYINLKAKSITITDLNGKVPSYLVRGKKYIAKTVIGNDSEIDLGAYKVGFYESGTLISRLDVPSHTKGTDKTLSYTFTASTSGSRVFKFNADDLDVIEESNETDNSISATKTVNYINLKAKSITITDLNGKVTSHLTKGKQYIAKTAIGNDSEIDLGTYKAGFYESGTLISSLDVSSHTKGTDQNLSYTFTASTAGTRVFKFDADDLDVIEESNETDNSISTTKLVNTLPVVTVSYTPNDVYEGDTVKVCTKPTDADNNPLTVNIFIKKDNGPEQNVLKQSNLSSGSQQCYSFVSQVGRYDIIATVNDGYDETEASTWFYSKALIINGYVKHTPEWAKKHLLKGNSPNQFYSGEKFMLEADTSPYPTVYVKSTFKAIQTNNNVISPVTSLGKSTIIFYKGELYDETFIEYPTNLKIGPASFEFEVKYSNGVIKKDNVTIEILSDAFKAYKIHRKY